MEGVRLPGERRHKNRLDTGPRKINQELIEKIKNYLRDAAILPPSTVSTAPVVFLEVAK